ncbi:hypothetical protein BC829DRAFT_441378 [Chytridium lagenaria]|nr:hypothetical protein BC829DRAFT_441378 [Chytridium lagenaria]
MSQTEIIAKRTSSEPIHAWDLPDAATYTRSRPSKPIPDRTKSASKNVRGGGRPTNTTTITNTITNNDITFPTTPTSQLSVSPSSTPNSTMDNQRPSSYGHRDIVNDQASGGERLVRVIQQTKDGGLSIKLVSNSQQDRTRVRRSSEDTRASTEQAQQNLLSSSLPKNGPYIGQNRRRQESMTSTKIPAKIKRAEVVERGTEDILEKEGTEATKVTVMEKEPEKDETPATKTITPDIFNVPAIACWADEV